MIMSDPFSVKRENRLSICCFPDCMFLAIPKFALSVYSSRKQFGYSFSFDAPTIWNDLPSLIRLDFVALLYCFDTPLTL